MDKHSFKKFWLYNKIKTKIKLGENTLNNYRAHMLCFLLSLSYYGGSIVLLERLWLQFKILIFGMCIKMLVEYVWTFLKKFN